MKKLISLALIPLLVACSSDEEELIKQQQQQIQQLQSQLQTSGVQEVTPSLPAAQYQQAPVVVQEHNDNGLLGGMAGFMLGQALGNNNNGGNSTHTERHYITNNTNTTTPNPANRIREAPRLPTTIRPSPTTSAPPVSKPSFWSSKPSISSGPSRQFSSKPSSSSSFRPSIRRK